MIDTHAHIDDEQYAEGLDAFLDEQRQGGVEAILVPGVNVKDTPAVWEVCLRYPDYLYPAIGLHPEEVKEDWQDALRQLKQCLDGRMASGQPYVAIGEIGLDYHFETTYKEQQRLALMEQFRWALAYQLPVMIHSRDATEDMLNAIRMLNKEYAASGQRLRGVMHCFSGSNEVARQIVEMGVYLGIGGVITFKNCRLRDNLQGIPLDALVLETDAPYMAPVPHRGERNESRWMAEVVKVLSEVYKCSEEQIDKVTTQNAKHLFGLK